MSNQTEIDELEITIEQAKHGIERGNALRRLYNNQDFQQIIMSGFLQQEALRLVIAKSEPGTQTPEAQTGILKGIDSIGYFHTHLLNIERVTEALEKSLPNDVKTLDEIHQEELE